MHFRDLLNRRPEGEIALLVQRAGEQERRVLCLSAFHTGRAQNFLDNLAQLSAHVGRTPDDFNRIPPHVRRTIDEFNRLPSHVHEALRLAHRIGDMPCDTNKPLIDDTESEQLDGDNDTNESIH